jgi:ligand-binding SRPBCC domain-containing protein
VPILTLVTEIHAPIERVFDLARSIDLHRASMTASQEAAVGGVMTGLIELGEEVTWRARHFGVYQRLTSRIVAFDRPSFFRDVMVSGIFARFDHDHRFEPMPRGTRMTDVFDYTSPLGALGRLADTLFLERYMRALLAERNRVIKDVAESERWRAFLRVDGLSDGTAGVP